MNNEKDPTYVCNYDHQDDLRSLDEKDQSWINIEDPK